MRLAIIGAGPVGALSAVLAAAHGHDVAVWCPRGAPRVGHRTGARLTIRCVGALAGEADAAMLDGPAALADWPNLLLAIPGDAYPQILPMILPVLSDGHVVVCGGALSLAPLWLAERATAQGRQPGIVAWGTTLGTGRILPGRDVQVGTIRARFELAALPAARLGELAALCAALFGDRFDAAGSLLVPLLSNINPVAHAGQTIPNLSRIERGEAWQLFECFGNAGARIAEAIDAERCAVARAFGMRVRSLARHYHLSYHVPEGSVASIAAAIEAGGRGPGGPARFMHRYFEEDIPFGLAVYETLGRIAAVATPNLSSCLTVLSTALDRPFRSLNPLLDQLGLENETVAGLTRRCAGIPWADVAADPLP